ncbi:MAG: hypothetical protein VKJ27_00280 [Synechocystis sp.]|nr:hypothetical protein [Synechocystis sp.]
MPLPPIHSFSETEYFVSGNVIIHETAAIAPGVIIDAGPDGHITIGAGVCIGVGTVITTATGKVDIESGVALAPGTLVIGPVTIGQAACIGSQSTIFQQDIAVQALIPPGDLLMVASPPPTAPRPPINSSPSSPSPENADIQPIPSPWDSGESVAPSPPPSNAVSSEKVPAGDTKQSVPPVTDEIPREKPSTETEVILTQPETADISDSPEPKAPVVGQVYINQLLLTLFPERKFFQS